MSMKKIFNAMVTILCLVLLFSCTGSDDERRSNLILNEKSTGVWVDWKKTDTGVLYDIGSLMEGVGGRFVPIYNNIGIVAQYGKRIGFSLNGNVYGMVQVKLCKMEPPAREEEGRLWAPGGFIEAVLNGKVTLDEENQVIDITAPDPAHIGDIIPAAGDLAQALEKLDYTVQQGDICLSNAIDVCYAGYSPNANGNNANFPYFITQSPLPPEVDHALVPTQFVYTVREDEGFILIGKTPPECDYYSYRSYFLNRCVSDVNPLERRKIYAQLGDPINTYNIGEEMFYPSGVPGITSPFESFFIVVSTPDRKVVEDVLEAVGNAGMDPNRVLLDIIDPNLVRLGNTDFADTIHFLHRFSNPLNKEAAEAYKALPTLEFIRITPNTPRQADFLEPFPLRTRGSGITEDFLEPAVAQLRQTIIDHYSPDYDIQELETHIWMEKSGAEAIAALEDVLGETRDTLYLKTDPFDFDAETIVVVYGVNHASIPKSVYSNVSCYGADYFNGFGGITNDMYEGNVSEQFSALTSLSNVDKLYVYKFARTKLDRYTYSVDQDADGDLKGINYGEKAFIGFRNYIDPDSPDLIGPAPDEIIFEKAIVLTPKQNP